MRVFVEPAGWLAGELPKVPVDCDGQGQTAMMTRHELADATLYDSAPRGKSMDF